MENGNLILLPKEDPCPNLEVAETTIRALKTQLAARTQALKQAQKKIATLEKQLSQQIAQQKKAPGK